MKRKDARLVSLGVCAFIFFSVYGRMEFMEVSFVGVISLFGLSYWIGSSFVKSIFILYLILNPSDVVFMVRRSISVVIYSFLYSTDIPVVNSLLISRSIYRSICKRRILPVAVSCFFCLLWMVFMVDNPDNPNDRSPLLFSGTFHLRSNSVYIHTGDTYYGKYGEKQGSGFRKVVGNRRPSVEFGWKISQVQKEGNFLKRNKIITSGSSVYVQDVRTGEYLQTADIASPLTSSNQEVSTSKDISGKNEFIILSETGDISKNIPIYTDSYFFLKHSLTGVFIRVVRRRTETESEGCEVNGEKETGLERTVGSRSALWSTGTEERIFSIKNIIQKIFTLKNFISFELSGSDYSTQPISKVTLGLFVPLFLLAALQGIFSSPSVREETLSCLIGIVLEYLFNRPSVSFYCAAVIGIRHGLSTNIAQIIRKIKID